MASTQGRCSSSGARRSSAPPSMRVRTSMGPPLRANGLLGEDTAPAGPGYNSARRSLQARLGQVDVPLQAAVGGVGDLADAAQRAQGAALGGVDLAPQPALDLVLLLVAADAGSVEVRRVVRRALLVVGVDAAGDFPFRGRREARLERAQVIARRLGGAHLGERDEARTVVAVQLADAEAADHQ